MRTPGLLGGGMRSLLTAQGVTIIWLSLGFHLPTVTGQVLREGLATPYPLYVFCVLTLAGALEWLDSATLGKERFPYLSALIWYLWGCTVFLQAVVLASMPTKLEPLIVLYAWLAVEAIRLSYYIQHRWTR